MENCKKIENLGYVTEKKVLFELLLCELKNQIKYLQYLFDLTGSLEK